MFHPSMYNTTKLTVELRDIVESGTDIWDFDYPSFYEGDDKKAFEQKVIDHFYFRQIGQETVGRFLHYFRSRIREIMPYYIQLYKSEKYMNEIEDPFATVDYTETYEEETNGTATGESSATSDSTTNDDHEHRFSNTPQGSISNLDNYMTEASVDDSNTTSSVDSSTTSSSESTGYTKHTLTKKGAMGVTTFGHDMIEYRESFLNIDMMIINNLQDLFLGVY